MPNDSGKFRPENYNLIMGRNCISEVLQYNPERFVRVYANSKLGDSRLKDLISDLQRKKITVLESDRRALDDATSSTSHQGIIAYLKPRRIWSLKDFLAKAQDDSLVLILDDINDPQNFGAILRVAEVFKVSAVIWSSNRGVGITPVVTKASVGASELLTLVEVSNLAEAVRKLKAEGFWVYASSLTDKSQKISNIKPGGKTALIAGSEESGVQDLLLKQSDGLFYIPQYGRIQSLNVSQAVAIMLYHFRG